MKKTLVILLAMLMIFSCNAAFAGEQTEDTTSVEISIISENGLTLRGYLKGPSNVLDNGETCPLIILMHGLMDSNEFDLIRKQADAYVKAGYAVLAMDFNGHGHSDGKLIDMTVSKELQDAEAILAYAKQLPFVSELILIGHSLGGIIASVSAARHSDEISHLVLLAPGGALADKMRAGSFFGQSFDPSDPPEKLMAFDDYVGRDYIVDAITLDPYGMAEGYAGHPVLLIGGSEDPLVNAEAIAKYETIYRNPDYHNDVTSKVINGAPHDFYEYEEQVISMVLEFLDQDSIMTIPMSAEAGEKREAMRTAGNAEIFAEQNYPALLQLIEGTNRNVFPEVTTSRTLTRSTVGGNEVYTLENDEAECIVLYIHGGAYVFGIDPVHVTLCEKLADRLNAKVVMPLYPLAPSGTWQDAWPFLDAVYEQILTEGKPVYLMGDSAGGGLSLAYALTLRDRQTALPEKIVLYSPWLDVTMENPEIKGYEEKDLQLKSYGLAELGKLWAADLSTKDPRISPIYGNLENLPPVLLFTGTDEVMYPDVTKLFHMLRRVGNPAQLVYGEGLWHVFVASDIPESDTALMLVEAFCK